MPRILLAGAMLGAIVLAQPERARGQEMPDGTWRGWLQQADQDSIRVSYFVQHSGKHILITLTGRSGIVYDMSDAKLRNDVLTFDWAMGLGAFLYCRLSRRDGRTFEGTCNDRSPGPTGKGVRVWLMMVPPDSARSDE
jgi:hypothetical protein